MQAVRTVCKIGDLELAGLGIFILLAGNSAVFQHIHHIALGPQHRGDRAMLSTAGGSATAPISRGGCDCATRRDGDRVRRSSGNHHNFREFVSVGELKVIVSFGYIRIARTIPIVSIDVLESELAGRVNRIATRQRNVRICITVARAIHLRHADVRPNSVVRGLVMHLDIIRGPVVLCLEVEREVLLGGHAHLQSECLSPLSFLGRDDDGA